MSSTKSSRKIDWNAVKIVIESRHEVNPKNPYASAGLADREQAMRELARTVLLRKVKTSSASA